MTQRGQTVRYIHSRLLSIAQWAELSYPDQGYEAWADIMVFYPRNYPTISHSALPTELSRYPTVLYPLSYSTIL